MAAAIFHWLKHSYNRLGLPDHQAGLRHIGYTRCWDDGEFIRDGFKHSAKFELILDECLGRKAHDTPIDNEERWLSETLSYQVRRAYVSSLSTGHVRAASVPYLLRTEVEPRNANEEIVAP